MKFLLVLGFLLGFGGVLAAAGLAPVAVQERVASHSSVANNGGRLETLIVRLPADRIVATGTSAERGFVIDPITAVAAPEALAAAPFGVEQFKLRDIDGDVIGVAMRHWSVADGAAASTWSLNIPSRGTLVWSSTGDAPGSLSAALAAAGVQPGVAWQGELRAVVAGAENIGRVIAGTEEFAGSTGSVEEVWEISGVGGNGELRGTITLSTRVSRTR